MLNFYEFLKETFLVESGQETSFRGQLNEIAMAHAIDRYMQLMNQHGGDHHKALTALANEGHVGKQKGHKYSGNIKNSEEAIGKDETDRTLWDSHHAAISLIDHLHKTEGGIAGPAIWSGPDVKGGTAEKVGGVKTQADILIPTNSGNRMIIKHASLKYSKDQKEKPTKLFQGTAREAVEHIQKHHQENFGKRDEALDSALNNLESTFGDMGERLGKHEDTLSAAGFKRKKDGTYPVTNITKMSRYADEYLDLKNKKNRNEKDNARLDKIHGDLKSHFSTNNVPENEHDNHIQNLAGIYNQSIRGDKVSASKNFSDAFTNALNKSFSEGKQGQHSLVRKLLNINERRKSKVLVVKTQRTDKVDHNKDPIGALPKTSFAIHSNDLEALYRKSLRSKLSENNMYKQVKDPKRETASSTIATVNGNKLASTSIDTSKTSPSLIIQAGNFENFHNISANHPLHPNYQKPTQQDNPSPVSQTPPQETYHSSHGGKTWTPE
jgi:hypothetical protein